ncbi:MAG: hypothetical protein ACRDRW_21380 [Pseudonocardiaceae bacterium]
MADGATPGARRPHRRAIPVTCALHRGPRGFANLVVERQLTQDGYDGHDVTEIVFDVHVAGACVIIMGEDAARVVFDVLGEWLGGIS